MQARSPSRGIALRVSFVGVPSTGKSTLSKEIAKRFPDHHYIEEGLPEVFAHCRKMGLPMNCEDIRKLDGPIFANFPLGELRDAE
jgi:adenylate kinase